MRARVSVRQEGERERGVGRKRESRDSYRILGLGGRLDT